MYQDRSGQIWIGFHDRGLVRFGGAKPRVYTIRDGLPSNEIFSIREDHRGDLLVSTREGPSRMHDGKFYNQALEDPMHRRLSFDFLEDRAGKLWVAMPGGLSEIENGHARNVIPGGPLLNDSLVVLCETKDGSLWAGSYGQGLWRWKDGKSERFTVADGLSNDQVRALPEDSDGTLWIGTFGGGLNAFAGREILPLHHQGRAAQRQHFAYRR